MKSQVTTKKGDAGQTTALDGEAFGKDHPLMEALGALDTMRAQIALLRTQLLEQRPDAARETGFLLFLLHACFLFGSALADAHNRKPEWHPLRLESLHLGLLEAEQARLEAGLQLPRAFIACASNSIAAQADIAAGYVRAFERRLVAFQRIVPEFNDPVYGAFANRLSDFLFILARHLEAGRHQPVDYTVVQPEHLPRPAGGRSDTV